MHLEDDPKSRRRKRLRCEGECLSLWRVLMQELSE
jgi:hypothetical protein